MNKKNNCNYIMRPEFFGGILINRDTFEKWYLEFQDMLYLWFYYHCMNHEESISFLNDIYDGTTNVSNETITFANNNFYEITSKYKSNKNNLIKDCLEMKKEISKYRYLSSPLELSLYITDNCQLNCKFCFMKGRNNSSFLMPIDKIKSMIEMFVSNGIESVSLLGGEPFLHPDIEEILRYLESKKVHYTITTNSINLTENILKKASGYKYLKIVFSVYSLNNNNYKYMGIYHKNIIEKIKLAKSYGIDVGINTVLVKQSYHDIEEIIEFCIYNDLQRYSLALFNDNNSELEHMSIYEALKIYFRIKNTYLVNKTFDFAVEGCMMYSALYSDEILEMNEFQKLSSGCQAAQTNLDIMSDGKAMACVLLKDIYVEDVFNKSFDQIWHSKVYDIIRDYKVDDAICNNCNYNVFCNGGCFVNKKIFDGKYEKSIDRKCSRLKNV